MNFGEKKTEYSSTQKKEIPVIQSPKYHATKAKAEEIITKGDYGINENDFWILMNETKTGKMMYSGLIISHNACLKINDKQEAEKRFLPECVSLDKEGYGDSLVYSYCSPTQGIFEVGEVSKSNCKNSYPYAMAFKRLFDRVVLKLSKVAFDGIMSESESDEFRNTSEPIPYVPKADRQVKEQNEVQGDFSLICEECKCALEDVINKDGSITTAQALADMSRVKTGHIYCAKHLKEHLSNV